MYSISCLIIPGVPWKVEYWQMMSLVQRGNITGDHPCSGPRLQSGLGAPCQQRWKSVVNVTCPALDVKIPRRWKSKAMANNFFCFYGSFSTALPPVWQRKRWTTTRRCFKCLIRFTCNYFVSTSNDLFIAGWRWDNFNKRAWCCFEVLRYTENKKIVFRPPSSILNFSVCVCVCVFYVQLQSANF